MLDPSESSQGLLAPFSPSYPRACGCAIESVHTELTSHFPSIPTYGKLRLPPPSPGFWELLNKTSL